MCGILVKKNKEKFDCCKTEAIVYLKKINSTYFLISLIYLNKKKFKFKPLKFFKDLPPTPGSQDKDFSPHHIIIFGYATELGKLRSFSFSSVCLDHKGSVQLRFGMLRLRYSSFRHHFATAVLVQVRSAPKFR